MLGAFAAADRPDAIRGLLIAFGALDVALLLMAFGMPPVLFRLAGQRGIDVSTATRANVMRVFRPLQIAGVVLLVGLVVVAVVHAVT